MTCRLRGGVEYEAYCILHNTVVFLMHWIRAFIVETGLKTAVKLFSFVCAAWINN